MQPRTIPCGHPALDFTCATCKEAIADPAGKGREWGVIPPEKTQANDTMALKMRQECIHIMERMKPVLCGIRAIHPTPAICAECSFYTRTLTEDLGDPISTAPQPEPQPHHIDGWCHDPEIIQQHLLALSRIVKAPYSAPKRSGRGIVTVGGGKYWLGIVLGIRMLRHIGCDLPVEIWHDSTESVNPGDLADLGRVSLHDIGMIGTIRGDRRTTRGWSNKLYALTHTKLAEVLFLDADAYCVADPSPLFDLLEQSPFVCWSDMDFHNADIRWPKVFPAGPSIDYTIQGGQLIIDTVQAWPLLRLTHWICQHEDFYFNHMYGDQDAWKVALAALAWLIKPLHLGAAHWHHPVFLCDYDGVTRVVHRCQHKVFPNQIPHESTFLRWYAEALETHAPQTA